MGFACDEYAPYENLARDDEADALPLALNRVYAEKDEIQSKILFLKNQLASSKTFNEDFYMMIID